VTDGLSQRAPAGSDYLSLAAMLVVPFCCKRWYPAAEATHNLVPRPVAAMLRDKLVDQFAQPVPQQGSFGGKLGRRRVDLGQKFTSLRKEARELLLHLLVVRDGGPSRPR